MERAVKSQITGMTDPQLDTLEAKGLIRPAVFQPELEYLFRHALVQDTAYESLLKQERRLLHRLVGEALEQLYPDRHAELSSVLARHFENASEPEKAIEYLAEAARFASDRNALVEAYELYSRAEKLLPPPAPDEDPALRRRRVEIGIGRAQSALTMATAGEVVAMLEPLEEQAELLGDLRLVAQVHVNKALILQLRGEPQTSESVQRSLDRLREVASELGDPEIALAPQAIVGITKVFFGQLREGVRLLAEASVPLEKANVFVLSAFVLGTLAVGYARLGRFDDADEAVSRAKDLGQRGDVIAKIDALIDESWVRSIKGDIEGAVPLAQQCAQMSAEAGATACLVASNFVLGEAYARGGSFVSARSAFERSDEVANAIEQRMFRPSVAAHLRSTAARLGDYRPKTGSFEDALAEARSLGNLWAEAEVLWKRAETEVKDPDTDHERALGDFQAARDAFEAMGARPYVARVLHDWGRALRQLGRNDEADQKLRSALELLEQMGITREADQVRLELATKPVAIQP